MASPLHLRLEPTQDELGDVRLAAEHLWELDIHRFVPGVDYELNMQVDREIRER